MRIPVRSIATLLMAIGVATCSDAPSSLVGTHPVPRRALGRVGFQPQFSRSAEAVYQQITSQGQTAFDSVRLVIRGYPDTTVIVKDTTVFFDDNSSALTLDLDVPVQTDGQRFSVGLGYENGHDIVFYGSAVVQSHPADKPAPPGDQTITVNYAGPGAQATRLTINPPSLSLDGNAVTALQVRAFDASNKELPPPPLTWDVSDASIASLSNQTTSSIQVSGLGRAGTVTVTVKANTLAAPSASAALTFTSPPKGIVLVSGGGQSGKVGSSLPQPAVVRVVAADGSGVPATTVIFSAPTGGSVGSSSVTTDGAGNASTSLKLGTTVGTQVFAATALGFSVGIDESATGGDAAAITVVSGDAQTDTVGHALKSPFVVKVADAFGNALSGVTVSWARTGSGTLAAATSTTDKDGLASVGYTLGNAVGSDAITASVNGLTAVAKFTATAVAGTAAKIEVVSGDKQVAAAGKALPAPFVVKVSDAAGNLVAGAVVTWTTTAGTIAASSTTDSKGLAQNTLTLGKTVGDATVTASVGASKSVTFTATAIPGPVTAVAFGTQPTSVAAGATLPSVTVTLTDAFGNVSNADAAVTIALGNNPGDATLGGTLTRTTVSGTATFDDLKLDKPGSGYTLVATSAGLTATSAAFNVTVGSPAHLQVIGASNVDLVAGTSGGLQKFLITDAAGNPVAGAAMHIKLTRASPDSTIADTNVTVDASGVFDLNEYIRQVKSAGVFTLVATVAGAQGSPATITATVMPAAANKVVFATTPSSGTAGGLLSPEPRVAIVDAFGNVVTGATNAVTVAIQPGSGTPGATLSGPATVSAVNGVATFTNLSIDKAGAGYCLEATSGTLMPSCSLPFPVNTGAAAQLIIQQQPTGGTAGGGIGAINVAIADASGNIITTATDQVTLALTTNPGSGTLTGTLTRSAVNGVATFGGLSIEKAAIGYRITASENGLTSAVTNAFNVSAGAAYALTSSSVPSAATSNVPLSPQPVVQVVDQFNNPVGSQTPFAVTVSSTNAAITPTPSTVSTNTTGYGVFTDLKLSGTGTTQLVFKSGTALKPDTTTPIPVSAQTATTFTVLDASGAPVASNAALIDTITAGVNATNGHQILITDASNTPVAGVSVMLAVTGPASTSGTLVTDAQGKVGLAGRTTLAGKYYVTASTSPALSGSPRTDTVVVVPAPASKFAFRPFKSPGMAGIATPIVVLMTDSVNNILTSGVGTADSVQLGIISGPSGGTLTNNGARATSGIATFKSLIFSTPGTYYLTALNIDHPGFAVAAPDTVVISAAPTMTAVTTQNLSAATGTSVVPIPVVKVVDTVMGVAQPLSNFPVLFGSSGCGTINGAAGSIADTVKTNSGGEAALTSWTAPASPTTCMISASFTSGSLPGVPFTLNATTPAPAPSATPTQVVSSGSATFSGTVGTALSGSLPSVTVKDASNNPVSGIAIIFSLGSDGSTVAPGKTADTVVTNASGIATLSGWTLPTAAGSYSAMASARDFTLAGAPLSFTASAQAGGITQLAFVSGHGAPSAIPDDSTLGTGPQIQLEDRYGNPVDSANYIIDAAANTVLTAFNRTPGPSSDYLASARFLSAPTISPNSATTNSHGLADFSGAKLHGKSQRFAIIFTVRDRPSIALSTADLNLNHGAAHDAYCQTSLPGIVPPGHVLTTSPQLQVVDVDSNLVDNTLVQFADTLGGTLSTSTPVTDASGIVTIPSWTVGATEGAHLLGLQGVGGHGCGVTVHKPRKLALSSTGGLTFTGKKNGDQLPEIDATVEDSLGNAMEDTSFSVAVTGSSHESGKHIFNSASAASDHHGKSSFSNLILDADEQTGGALVFSVPGESSVATDSVTFDAISAGTETAIGAQGNSDTLHVSPGNQYTGLGTVAVKDHNKRNGLTKSGVQVTWAVVPTSCIDVSITGANPNSTGTNGQAPMPTILVGAGFVSGCRITATAVDLGTNSSLGVTTFTLVTP